MKEFAVSGQPYTQFLDFRKNTKCAEKINAALKDLRQNNNLETILPNEYLNGSKWNNNSNKEEKW